VGEYITLRDCQAGPPGAVRVWRAGDRAVFPPSYRPPHHFKRVSGPAPVQAESEKVIDHEQPPPVPDMTTAVEDAIRAGEVIKAGAGAGRPTVAAMGKRLGIEIGSKDRDEAYEAWLAAKNK